MKTLGVCLASGAWLILLYFAPTGLCQQRIHCQWGAFGEWSACDPCTKLQSRSRAMVVYAQFGGRPCAGQPSERRACETTQHCPLGEGCRNRFRCLSGKCISLSLVCNGDQDCEGDSLDEATCGPVRHKSCDYQEQTLPNVQDLGLGFDAVTGQQRGTVINTQSFGGQCRTIEGLAGNNVWYRLPLSTLSYKYGVKIQKDLSEELYSSSWEYSKTNAYRQTVTGTTTGSTSRDSAEAESRKKKTHLLVLKSDIELATFQNQDPQFLPISEAFWGALSHLPPVYDYAAYLEVLKRFGTHYPSEGTIGGSLRTTMYISEDRYNRHVETRYSFAECDRPFELAFIIPLNNEYCSDDSDNTGSRNNFRNDQPLISKTEVKGGRFVTALSQLNLEDPSKNWRTYSDWVDSLTSFPAVTKQKLRPLSELVKEVACAGVKRLHLRRAIEQYVAEAHPCHCRPCQNNGLAVRSGASCQCVCRPGTAGLDCGQGRELEGQPGVIHGSWSCWSQWSSCSANQRSRSRVCSNPRPANGGLHCIGVSAERSECEDREMEHYRNMEPECFDFSLASKKKCGTPPVLINGFVSNPQDVYLVGNTVEYRCIAEYHLVGDSITECMEDQTWSQQPGTCDASKCTPVVLDDEVTVSPLKGHYSIGERVTLSCPPGQQLLGEAEIICDPSLHFSPSPDRVRCSQRTPTQPPDVQCPPGEKSSGGKCVCRFPYECTPSLEVCAVLPQREPVLLSVCKLHSLRCLGKNHTLVENSACQWPMRAAAAACDSCGLWEVCDDQTNACRCKEASECAGPEVRVCARVGSDGGAPAAMMAECEVGRRRCGGEHVTVLSLQPCDSF